MIIWINIHIMEITEGEEKEKKLELIWKNSHWKPPKYEEESEHPNSESSEDSNYDNYKEDSTEVC